MAWEEIWIKDKHYFETSQHYYDSTRELIYKETTLPHDREDRDVRIEYMFVLFGPLFILHGTYTRPDPIICKDPSIKGGAAFFQDYQINALRTQDVTTGSVARLTTDSAEVEVYLDLLFAYYKARHEIYMSKSAGQSLSTIRDLVFACRDTGKHIRIHNPQFDPYVEIIRKQLGL